MSTSKNYPGQNVLISYLKERGNKSSYHGFLDLHHDIIVTSTFSENWKDLDNSWATHFMEEAEKLNLEALKEKRNLQIFWQEVIKEYYEKENLVPSITSKVTSTKDFSETSQQKNSELINFCYDILHELENKSCAYPFKYINKADKVIKHPIDLFTINLKLKNNQYKSLKEFEKDVRLIFRN
ncbi:10639_t:CDS:2, partial [Rhizophagus irregularis]